MDISSLYYRPFYGEFEEISLLMAVYKYPEF